MPSQSPNTNMEITLIGIGTGNPDHVTAEAVQAMNAANMILIPLKGEEKADLAGLRQAICARFISNPAVRLHPFDLPARDQDNPDYLSGVDDWHDAVAEAWACHIRAHFDAGGGGRIALLVWGDPSLYDSTLRIAARIGASMPITLRVIPGITAIQALCAAHAIPLNNLGRPVHLTTGRRLRQDGWPNNADTVVVMLDGGGAFLTLPPQGISIWWGAYVGMREQILLSGPLEEVSSQVLQTRANARKAHGWIMDIYLMRRALT